MKQFTVNIFCRCGCGAFIEKVSKATYHRLKRGDPVGYLPGHAHRGENNPRWNNRETFSHGKYLMIWRPDHPNARKSGYILAHRLIMSLHLGRPLLVNEIVHHKNGNGQDNRVENLEIVSRHEHRFMHDPNENRRREHDPKTCAKCGNKFLPKIISNYDRNKFCSRKCMHQYLIGENAPNAKLTDEQVEQIRFLKGKKAQRKIATQFDISKTQVGRIHRGESR